MESVWTGSARTESSQVPPARPGTSQGNPPHSGSGPAAGSGTASPAVSRQSQFHARGAASRPEPTIGLFGLSGQGPDHEVDGYRPTRRARMKRLHQIARIAAHFDALHGLTPVTMRLMFEALGPTFVKMGQILSMRSEILPDAFCHELSKLRADADPIPYATVMDTLAQEYDRPLERIFASIDPTPLGSASLAQVHRARLVTGEDVAVKVQRPGVRETMVQDIDIMRTFVKWAGRVAPKRAQVVDIKGVVEELWQTFQTETNFVAEAHNLEEFKQFCRPYAYIDCPKPYLDLCTEHVVVMDYVEGISVSKPGRLVAAGYDLGEIGTKLVDNYATQILDAGFFHADPHPGNIIIRDGRIVLIDLGMVGRLDAKTRAVLQDMIFAVGKEDSPALAEGLLRFTGTAETRPDDYSTLLSDLDAIVQEYGKVDLADLDIAEYISSIMLLAQRHNIKVPSSVTMVARCLVTLEGLLDEFLPNANMVQIITQHVTSSVSMGDRLKQGGRKLGLESDLAVHGLLGALAESRTAARMLTRGQLRANVQIVGSEEPLRQLSDMVNRLAMALIVVGLYVGSSIVYFARIKPFFFGIPLVGLLGYVVAFILSAWIVLDILLKNRASKRRQTRHKSS
ncbi:ABC1 kinase family protein [Bifidobacterium xylocopae]|uniref:ABC transporter n=1 Tax=Bifidobacterium xylocopae TaxID=2493119 RepID=A0A366KE68_9BIFI|nr:ABC transporter [Bifidobacterium xylocopae]